MEAISVEKFGWQSYNYAPPKYCKVVRANDQFLVLKRTRNDFVETLIAAKIGDGQFAVFRSADSLGELAAVNWDTLIYKGPLAHVLAVMGYNTKPPIDRRQH